jgi:hypothetical protein
MSASDHSNETERDVADDSAGTRQSLGQPLDQETCQSICDAIGARLQRDLSTTALAPSARLERLIEEMRRREAEGRTG